MLEKTDFEILSHACLWVKRGKVGLIIDPWLLGSCYWRSWWNYPEPEINEDQLKSVTHVMLSHIHWDHWHGLSLKKYFQGCQFIVPDEPKSRSYDDLVRLRLGEVQLIKHGETIHLGHDVKVTVHQFGLFLNDAAIIIETPEAKILNANDVKIAGWPLKKILRQHGHFDFALRSHSTANFRACISIENQTTEMIDDNDHYARSFKLFMDAVQPTYAVPFASNHCHLHKETYHFNQVITNPLKLKKWLNDQGGLEASELKIMLPGSSWSSQDGFQLRNLDPFDDLEQKIAQYQQKKSPMLEAYYQLEAKQTLGPTIISKHEEHLKSIPKIARKLLKNNIFGYKIMSDDQVLAYFQVDVQKGTVIETNQQNYQAAAIKMVWPVLIFKQAITLKMYAHAFISKRVHFLITDNHHLKNLCRLLGYLEKIEHELFPLRWRYIKRLVSSYYRRWREVFLYFTVIKQVILHKKSLPAIEEIILQKSKIGQ